VPTREIGVLPLYLIYNVQGVWESRWRPLQGHPVTEPFTVVQKELIEHALLGLTSPLVKALGLFPAGCLRKLPLEARECAVRRRCPFFNKAACTPLTSKIMPWCYEPEGIEADLKPLVSEVIGLWRSGVYVTLVCEEAS
jgi:hypothetical protein